MYLAEREPEVVIDVGAALRTPLRECLNDRAGRQTPVSALAGRAVWVLCGTPIPERLPAVYAELQASHPGALEVVQLPATGNALDVPWLCLPAADVEGGEKVRRAIDTQDDALVMLDASGRVLSKRGADLIARWGAEGWPFTPERVRELSERVLAEREAAQTLEGLLCTPGRDYLVAHDGASVPVASLAGKTVALYYGDVCRYLTPILVEVYRELRARGVAFEVVFVSRPGFERKQEFEENFAAMPWLALPYDDREASAHMTEWFEVRGVPSLIVLGPDGKTVAREQHEAARAVEEFGADAFPFTPEHLQSLFCPRCDGAPHTLAGLLATPERDWLLRGAAADAVRVPISSLAGKFVALYLCDDDSYSPQLTASLKKTQAELAASGTSLEVVVVFVRKPYKESAHSEEEICLDGGEGELSWLSVPANDQGLSRRIAKYFKDDKFDGFKSLVILDDNGKVVCEDASMFVELDVSLFPYTEEKLLEHNPEAFKEFIDALPKRIKLGVHEHPLLLSATKSGFNCCKCEAAGKAYAYVCTECSYILHPKCVDGAISILQ